MEIGKAYVFFNCKTSKKEIEWEILAIREMVNPSRARIIFKRELYQSYKRQSKTSRDC